LVCFFFFQAEDGIRDGHVTGVQTCALPIYERRGLLPLPRRSANNYREYPPAALERVLLVRRALSLSFTVAELEKLLAVRNRGGRSEERRVGKECGAGRARAREKEKRRTLGT